MYTDDMPHHYFFFHIDKKKSVTWFDKLFMLAAIAFPFSALPQIIDVFSGNTEGVSIASWLMFAFFSMLFLTYGSIHKVKPMVVTNCLWLVAAALIVAGLLLDRI